MMPSVMIEITKLREECGVFGIYGHSEAARLNSFAIPPPAKSPFSKHSLSASLASTDRSQFVTTETFRSHEKSDYDSNAKARSFRQHRTRKSCFMASRVR